MKSRVLACLLGTAVLAGSICAFSQVAATATGAATPAVTAVASPPIASADSDPNYLGMSVQVFNDSNEQIVLKNLHASHTVVIEPGQYGWMERKGDAETDVKFVVKMEGHPDIRVDANNPNTSWPNIKLTKGSEWWRPYDEFKRFSVDETWALNFVGRDLKFKRTGDDHQYKRFTMRVS